VALVVFDPGIVAVLQEFEEIGENATIRAYTADLYHGSRIEHVFARIWYEIRRLRSGKRHLWLVGPFPVKFAYWLGVV
jgi:hypothetical protein